MTGRLGRLLQSIELVVSASPSQPVLVRSRELAGPLHLLVHPRGHGARAAVLRTAEAIVGEVGTPSEPSVACYESTPSRNENHLMDSPIRALPTSTSFGDASPYTVTTGSSANVLKSSFVASRTFTMRCSITPSEST